MKGNKFTYLLGLFHVCPLALLAVLVIAALRLWAWDLQMEIKVLESIIQVEQQGRRKSAEQAKQLEAKIATLRELNAALEHEAKISHGAAMDCAVESKNWKNLALEFRAVVKEYEGMMREVRSRQ